MFDRNEVKFKSKKCPLNKFDRCIGDECAFYDESGFIENIQDRMIEKFSYCSISYLPIIFDELRDFYDKFAKFRDNLGK